MKKKDSYNIELVEKADGRNRPSQLDSPLLDASSHLKKALENDHEKEEEDFTITSCGIGSWRPPRLQIFASPIFFMLNMALIGIIQGMTAKLFISSVTTFEKRYAFDSKISAIILIADNFAEVFLNPIAGYLAVRFNRARLIAIGEIILAFSCFLTALPYFVYGPAKHLLSDQLNFLSLSPAQSNFEMCSKDDVSVEDCSDGSGTTVWFAVCLLVFGSFARGIGVTCYYVIGYPFIDDNVSKEKSPLYISAMQAIRLLGPTSGFLLSSFCLRLYEDPTIDPGFGRDDPRFVGAWWLGFIITGALLFFATLPMFLFPPEFKNATVKRETIQKSFKKNGGTLAALKRLFTNPLVNFYIVGNIFRANGLGGFSMFKSKYIEAQYRQSASSAGFLTGISSFLPMAIGTLFGGFIISFFKPSPRTVFIYVFIVESVSLFTVGSGLFLGCAPVSMNGQVNDLGKFSLDNSCNVNCNCSTHVFTPICDSMSQTTYFSPCHAGCSSYNMFNSSFQNCSCFDGTAGEGYCKPPEVEKCNNLPIYIAILTIGSMISASARTPNFLIAMRSVDPMDKAFTIGIASTLMDLLAFMSFPLFFGWIVDSVCLIWESKCGQTGNCWLYDNDRFRIYLHGFAMLFMAIGSLFDFIMIFYAGRVKNFYESDDAKKTTTNGNAAKDENSKETLIL